MYKIVRCRNGVLSALTDERFYEEGVRYEGVFFAHYDLRNAIIDAKGFAEIFGHVLVYEIDAEPMPRLPSRFPNFAAPERLRQRWTELVAAGQIEEADRLFEGELQICSYPLTAVTLVRSFILLRKILRFRNYFDELRRKFRYEVTILAPDVGEQLICDYCAGWEIKRTDLVTIGGER